MKKLTAILCAACLMLTAMTGCAKKDNPSQSGGSGGMIALITMDSIDQHWITLNEGAQKAAGELGVNVQFMSPNTKDDAQQIECVNNAVSAGAKAIIVAANIWGKGMIKIIPILLGVVGSYVVAVIANAMGATALDAAGEVVPLIDFSTVAASSPIGLQPFFTDFGGSIAKFDLTSILVMAPIAIAAMMEHIGDMSAISATVGENFIEDPGLHRTLVGDGLATTLSALFGGPANTTYGENTGVLVLSRVFDPKVIRLAAIYAVVLGFIPKMSEVIGSMPTAIVGGISFMLYGMISAIGVRNIVENQVDFTNSRNLIIAAVILVCGLGFSGGLTFHVGGISITLTALAIAAIAGILLNAILPGNDYEFGSNPSGDQHRGIHQ